jgi:4-amino-4-deoxy-L-arabinose transferase-like glycosyltransferase
MIVIAGLILRLYDLDGESIWVDEGQTIYLSSHDLPQVIEESSNDNHPPLYTILLHFWMKIVPHTTFYFRLLSVIFGVLAIILIYIVGKELIDQNTGLVSAFFLAFSILHLHFSQEVRSYMLVVVLILLSYYLLIRLDRQSKLRILILYIIVNTFLVYTHFLGWFIILAQNIFYAIQFPLHKDRFKHVIIADAIIVVLYLPWLNTMLARFSDLQKEFWVSIPTWLSIPQAFLVHAGTYTIFGMTLLLVFFILCLRSLFVIQEGKIRIRRLNVKEKYLVLLWMWIPILIPFVLSFVFAPVFITRITIGASLALYLLSAIGLVSLPKKSLKIGVSIFCFILFLGNCSIYYKETNKERWKEATEFIEKNAQSGDLLIFHAGFCLDRAFNYYAERDDLIKQSFPEVGLDVNQDNIHEVTSRLEDFHTVWVILSHSRDKNNLILKTIETEFKLINHKEYISKGINSHRPYTGIEIFQFSSPGSGK